MIYKKYFIFNQSEIENKKWWLEMKTRNGDWEDIKYFWFPLVTYLVDCWSCTEGRGCFLTCNQTWRLATLAPSPGWQVAARLTLSSTSGRTLLWISTTKPIHSYDLSITPVLYYTWIYYINLQWKLHMADTVKHRWNSVWFNVPSTI